MYNCPPGFLVIVLRCLGCLWLCYNINTTLNNFRSKRGFYYKFAAVSVGWCASLPIIAALANSATDEWVRMKVVVISSLTFNFAAKACLVFLYNPVRLVRRSMPGPSTSL